MNTIDMNAKRVGSFAPLPYQMHHLEQANSPPFLHHNGLPNRIGYGTPGSPLGMPGMSPAPSTSSYSSPPRPGPMAVPSPQSSTSGKSDPPKRLRYWLIDMIESGQIPGLRWEDENKTIFRIPWKHAGKNNWKEDDCRIFKAWAEHRGKYKEGVDKFDPATWKTRLRCALNKLPDIKELKDRSQLEGTDPFRVYRLLPEPDRNQDFEIYPRNTWGRENYSPIGVQDRRQMRHSDEGGMYGQQRPYQDHYSRHGDAPMEAMPSQNTIAQVHHGILNRGNYPLRDDPSTEFSRMRVKDSGQLNVVPPPIDDQTELEFRDHSIRPHLSSGDGPIRPPEQHGHGHHHTEVQRTTSNGSSNQRQHQNRGLPIDTSPALINPVSSPVGSESGHGPDPVSLQPPSQMLSHSDQSPNKHELDVLVHYRGALVMNQHVTNLHGCRIHHGNSGLQHIATVAHELGTHVFGPQDLEQIELVAVEPFATFEKQINLTNHLLKNVQRGLLLSLQNDGTIVAKRLCQSRVFFMSPESNQNEPEKLERNTPTVVFDYKNFFSQLRKFAADQYNQMSQIKMPDIEVKISFGQTWSMKNPLDKNLISLVIIPSAAHYLLAKVRERHNDMMSINNSILDSGPSSDDRLAERVTRDSEEYVDELISALMRQEGNVNMDGMKREPQGGFYQDVDMEQGY